MATAHVFDVPPPGAGVDWTMPQDFDRLTTDQHATWNMLVASHATRIAPYASSRFLRGLDLLQLGGAGIPDHRELNARLHPATGWTVVAVPGAIPNQAFFAHLAERRFPAANFLRSPDSLDYSEEPDMFHDLFGHLPMLTDPCFADFMQSYGQAGLRAGHNGGEALLGRLYLHTVEFGLVAEEGGLRGFGAGLLSSFSETVQALTGAQVRRFHFDLHRVMRTGYLFDRFQKEYFVIASFEALLHAMESTDLSAAYRDLQHLPVLEPGSDAPGDRAWANESPRRAGRPEQVR